MPCKTCGHDTENCDACQGVGGSQHTGYDAYTAEHKKHVDSCNPDVAAILRPTDKKK
jgi:hypothetical protein